MISRRTVLLGTAGLVLAASMPVRAAAAQVLGGRAFGSYWRLTIPDNVNGGLAGESVETVIRLIDNAMSPYLPASDLSRFNESKSTNWAPMSDVTSAVIDTALHVAARTGGAFDPTVGPIVGRFGFGPIHDGSTTGSYLGLDVRAGAVRKYIPDLTIDLCGVAKGHALDLAAAALSDVGIGDFLLELGGEVFAQGTHPAGRPWQVGVERPFARPTTVARVIRPSGMALATSGVATQGYSVGQRFYSHVIDPSLGEPAENSIASVSVLMPTGAAADAYATALMAMGPEAGVAFARAESIAALFQLGDGGDIAEVTTADFINFVEA